MQFGLEVDKIGSKDEKVVNDEKFGEEKFVNIKFINVVVNEEVRKVEEFVKVVEGEVKR